MWTTGHEVRFDQPAGGIAGHAPLVYAATGSLAFAALAGPIPASSAPLVAAGVVALLLALGVAPASLQDAIRLALPGAS